MLIIFINFDNNNFIFYRESETLQTQLSAALRQIEPLKQVSNRQLQLLRCSVSDGLYL